MNDAGYKALYGGLGRDAIKQRKTIPDKDNLLDRMNATDPAGLIDRVDAKEMLAYEHSGFSVNAAVCIEAQDRAALERLLRCCARPPFAMERRRKAGVELVYRCANRAGLGSGGATRTRLRSGSARQLVSGQSGNSDALRVNLRVTYQVHRK